MSEQKNELAKIVGTKNVFDDPEFLESYSKDQSFVLPMIPRFVVKPTSVDQVQEIVKWANEHLTPLVPVSSGPPHFRGDTIPSQKEAVIIDLSRMRKIVRIDRRNRMIMIEPGVTFGQLLPELAKEGLKLSMPLLPRNNKSVIASLLEREPTLIPKYQWSLTDPLRCLEIVWGNGEKLMTGEAGSHGSLEEEWKMGLAQVSGFGPGQIDFYRLVSAAQGSIGIATWATVKCEILPQIHKLLFASSERLDNLIDFAYRLLRFRYADELLFLNNSNLASILGEKADQIRALSEKLPPWILVLGVAGRDILPSERVEFQTKDITEIAQKFNVQLVPAIPGATSEEVLKALLNPSKEPYWKLRGKGGCQDIIFLTTLDRTPEFIQTMYSASEAAGYPTSEINIYIQPVHQGAACHCEFSLPYDPSSPKEATKIQKLLAEGSEALINRGAFFSRPYGTWASMAYNRDAQSTTVLKKVKEIFDPNNVMNPGKLCF